MWVCVGALSDSPGCKKNPANKSSLVEKGLMQSLIANGFIYKVNFNGYTNQINLQNHDLLRLSIATTFPTLLLHTNT